MQQGNGKACIYVCATLQAAAAVSGATWQLQLQRKLASSTPAHRMPPSLDASDSEQTIRTCLYASSSACGA
eukprot:359062-Chlamydomonas_euryale.AAC.9